MAIDYQRLYHTGIRVPNLDAAMIEMGRTLDVTRAQVRDMPEEATASGMIVEVVSETIKGHFEPWWAEGLARAGKG